jgi:hypothetical protein
MNAETNSNDCSACDFKIADWDSSLPETRGQQVRVAIVEKFAQMSLLESFRTVSRCTTRRFVVAQKKPGLLRQRSGIIGVRNVDGRGVCRRSFHGPALPARRLEAADRRRTRIRSAVTDRRRVAVRGLPASATSAARLSSPATCPSTSGPVCRLGAPHRCAARSYYPSRSHPRDERRQLQAQTQQAPRH